MKQSPNPKRIIVLGSIPLSLKVIRYLHGHPNVELTGVITEQRSHIFKNDAFSDICVYDYACLRNMPLTSIEDVQTFYEEESLFLAISGRAPYILKSEFLSRFKKGVLNMHGGVLPEMRGVHNSNHAILDNWGYSGGTLHYMDSGIDTGPIIARSDFKIGPNDTAYDVFRMTQFTLWQLFLNNIESVLNDRDKPVSQKKFINSNVKSKYYGLESINAKRKLESTLDFDEIYRRARGYDYPGHEPAYFEIEGAKVYVTTKEIFCRSKHFFLTDRWNNCAYKHKENDRSDRAVNLNSGLPEMFRQVKECESYGLLPPYLEEEGRRVYLTTKIYSHA